MNCHVFPTRRRSAGFTLIELLTVIAIIGVLMALLFPAIGGAMDNAKKAQAKNDIMQTITAVKGFYTEYSRYPTLSNSTAGQDLAITTAAANAELFNILRYKGDGQEDNPRGIVFFEGKTVAQKKGGFGPDDALYDPWGGFYQFVIDTDYDNLVDVSDIDGKGAAGDEISTGVAGMSKGKKPESSDTKDDVTSW